jgi:hypothetical protein
MVTMPARPMLSITTPSGGSARVRLVSDANTGFGLSASTNLTNWTPIAAGVTDTNGVLSFDDHSAGGFSHRFCRAYWPLP